MMHVEYIYHYIITKKFNHFPRKLDFARTAYKQIREQNNSITSSSVRSY